MKNQGIINKYQRGNAFVVILVIIALLGALTVTMTRMGESENNVSQEEAQILASQIMRQAKTFELAVQKLQSSGCSEQEISFENSIVNGYVNSLSPTDKRCHIFELAGAGLSWPSINTKVLDPAYQANSAYGYPFISGANNVFGVYPNDINETHKKELLYIYPFINKTICQAINNKLWNISMNDAPPYDANAFSMTKFNGTYPTAAAHIWGGAAGYFDFSGQMAGCFVSINNSSPPSGANPPSSYSGEYVFYQVLIAR